MSIRNGVAHTGHAVVVRILHPSQTIELAKALASELDRLSLMAPRHPPGENRIVTGVLSIDIGGHEAVVADSVVDLKPREFALLKALAENLGCVLSRNQLLDLAWPDPPGVSSNRTVDVHVRRLRRKLGEAAGLIRTVGGAGYKLARLAAENRRQQ